MRHSPPSSITRRARVSSLPWRKPFTPYLRGVHHGAFPDARGILGSGLKAFASHCVLSEEYRIYPGYGHTNSKSIAPSHHLRQ